MWQAMRFLVLASLLARPQTMRCVWCWVLMQGAGFASFRCRLIGPASVLAASLHDDGLHLLCLDGIPGLAAEVAETLGGVLARTLHVKLLPALGATLFVQQVDTSCASMDILPLLAGLLIVRCNSAVQVAALPLERFPLSKKSSSKPSWWRKGCPRIRLWNVWHRCPQDWGDYIGTSPRSC